MDITALGELLIDFTAVGRSENGMLLFEQNPGGAVANVAVAAARCGAKAAFIGKVGADMQGCFLAETLAEAGVDIRGLRKTQDAFTTLAFVALSAEGERSFAFARKPGADTCLTQEELDIPLLQSTRILHTGSLSLTDEPARSATYAAIRIAKAAGAIISYDPNYRASLWPSQAEACRAMASLIPWADILKLSQEEVALLTGENDPQAAAWALRRQGVAVVAVTLGKMGALVLAGQETSFVPAYPARAVDATGAGDAFFGGFLYRFLGKGRSPQALTIGEAVDCARFGNATASLCVEGRGGIRSMPALDAILRRME